MSMDASARRNERRLFSAVFLFWFSVYTYPSFLTTYAVNTLHATSVAAGMLVGSYGLTSPYKVRAQWLKNVGNQVEVLTGDGRKLHGTLKAVGDEEFTLAVPTRVKPEGKKRPVTQDVDHTMRCDEIKYIKNIITI